LPILIIEFLRLGDRREEYLPHAFNARPVCGKMRGLIAVPRYPPSRTRPRSRPCGLNATTVAELTGTGRCRFHNLGTLDAIQSAHRRRKRLTTGFRRGLSRSSAVSHWVRTKERTLPQRVGGNVRSICMSSVRWTTTGSLTPCHRLPPIPSGNHPCEGCAQRADRLPLTS